jgi:hypothetical protein
MSDLFASGRVIDAIIAFMVLEALALVVAKSAFGRGLSVREAARVLLPGLALLLALRAALVGQAWTVIAFFLLASLVAHLADLRHRLATSTPSSKAQA